MSNKRKKAHPVQAAKPKSDVVWRQSAEEATLAATTGSPAGTALMVR